jgi:hypothetical protein
MKLRTAAGLMGLMALTTALVAISLAWKGNISGALIAALNGITVAVVALGWQVAGK